MCFHKSLHAEVQSNVCHCLPRGYAWSTWQEHLRLNQQPHLVASLSDEPVEKEYSVQSAECRTALDALFTGTYVHTSLLDSSATGVARNEEADRLSCSEGAFRKLRWWGKYRFPYKRFNGSSTCTWSGRRKRCGPKHEVAKRLGLCSERMISSWRSFSYNIFRSCGTIEETVEHILCRCPALSILRIIRLGIGFLSNMEAAAK